MSLPYVDMLKPFKVSGFQHFISNTSGSVKQGLNLQSMTHWLSKWARRKAVWKVGQELSTRNRKSKVVQFVLPPKVGTSLNQAFFSVQQNAWFKQMWLSKCEVVKIPETTDVGFAARETIQLHKEVVAQRSAKTAYGAVSCLLLDEISSSVAWIRDVACVTAEMKQLIKRRGGEKEASLRTRVGDEEGRRHWVWSLDKKGGSRWKWGSGDNGRWKWWDVGKGTDRSHPGCRYVFHS